MKLKDALGVCVHNYQIAQPANAAEYALLTDVFTRVRTDLVWSSIEQTKGVYNLTGTYATQYKTFVDNLRADGITVMALLCYGNSLYDCGYVDGHTGFPTTATQQKAFAAYAKAMVAWLGTDNIIYEIWNEPNGFGTALPETYAKLLRVTSYEIKQAYPAAEVMGYSVAPWLYDYLADFVDSNGCKYIDYLSFHSYYQGMPENRKEMWDIVRPILNTNEDTRNITVIDGEAGYTSYWSGFDAPTKAKCAVRKVLFNISQNLPFTMYYDWKDDGSDQTDFENLFGLIEEDSVTVKEAYEAYKVLRDTLGEYDYVCTMDNTDVYKMLFKNGTQTAIVAWTVGGESGTVDLQEMPSSIKDYLGADVTPSTSVAISGFPTYILFAESLYNVIEPLEIPDTSIKIQAHKDVTLKIKNTTTNLVTMDTAGYIDALGSARRRAFLPSSNVASYTIKMATAKASQPTGHIDFTLKDGTTMITDSVVIPYLKADNMVVASNISAPTGGLVSVTITKVGTLSPRDIYLRINSGTRYKLSSLQKSAVSTTANVDAFQLWLVKVPFSGTTEAVTVEVLDKNGVVLHTVSRGALVPYDIRDLTWNTNGGAGSMVKTDLSSEIGVKLDLVFPPTGLQYFYTESTTPKLTIPTDVTMAGMWAKVTGARANPAIRLIDSKGQYYQSNYGGVTWPNWRWVSMPITDGFAPATAILTGDKTLQATRPLQVANTILVDGAGVNSAVTTIYMKDLTFF